VQGLGRSKTGAGGFAGAAVASFLQTAAGAGKLTHADVQHASKPVAVLFRWLLSQVQVAGSLRSHVADLANMVLAEDQLAAARITLEEFEAAACCAGAQAAAAAEKVATAEAVLVDCETALANYRATPPPSPPRSLSPTPVVPAASPEADAIVQNAVDSGAIIFGDIPVSIRERVTFSNGSSDISSVVVSQLSGVVRLLQDHGNMKVCVEGFAGPDESSGDRLSLDRANKVMAELRRQGVPAHRLRAAGFGSGGAVPEAKIASGRVQFSVIQEITVRGTVCFGAGSSSVTRDSNRVLDQIVSVLLARPTMRVRVEGHTCNCPMWGMTNEELSSDRAAAVVDYLRKAGAGTTQAIDVGFGDKLPLASNNTRAGKDSNRRVEFHILQTDTILSLQQLLRSKRLHIAQDASTRHELLTAATGHPVPFALDVRWVAAGVLRASGVDWHIQRLFWLASVKGDPRTTPAANLQPDVVQRIFVFFFLLGCASVAQ